MNLFNLLLLIALSFVLVPKIQAQTLLSSDQINLQPTPSLIAQNPRTLSSLESQVLLEINRIRLNPQAYIARLEGNKAYYNGNILTFPNEAPITTQEGIAGVNSAIEFLKGLKPLPLIRLGENNVITPNPNLTTLADRIMTYGSSNQLQSNPRKAAEMIVMQLIINDGFPQRNQRLNLFNNNLQLVDLLCGEGSANNYVCVLSYTGNNLQANFRVTNSQNTSQNVTNNNVNNNNSPNINNPNNNPNNRPNNNNNSNNPNNNSSSNNNLALNTNNICVNEAQQNNPNIVYQTPLCMRGNLANGDTKLGSDNSFYDNYLLYVPANSHLRVTLESEDFDTFLAIQDPQITDIQRQIIQQNDDIDENNRNSVIEFTVSREGIYRVIVNSYEANSQGSYILRVTNNQ